MVTRPVNPVVLLGKQDTHRLNDGLPKMTAAEIEDSKRELLARFGED